MQKSYIRVMVGAIDIADRVAAVERSANRKRNHYQIALWEQGLRTGTSSFGSAGDDFFLLAYLLEFSEDAVAETSFWPFSLILAPFWRLFMTFQRQILAAAIPLKTKD